ncbi:hypothetical protein ACFFJY_14935 [Fictibacillus aquaticus]|uniref:Uncharacterized protein n=1 Tax=Fictibacillus aquaticus TaxID=2021314 RepID=A0A235FDS5_9BACL|nr:hypothetical protein [Fictibacillus aquaticus]OYD59508.1 hypothetical protein CGZ90_06350 [Fictibacillus aquaticus]
MLKKILKSLLGSSHKKYSSSAYKHKKSYYKKYSSSDYKHGKHYGHKHYKGKHKSSFFSS